jgi:cation diffusion facilitator family transporter
MNRSGTAGRNVALASIFISGGLAAAKIVVGLKANSTAVVSDGIESASDILASSLVLFGLVMAAKPPDAEHPYGHGRLETLSGMAVGIILVVTGSLISVESLRRGLTPHNAPAAFAVWPLLLSIAVKSSMYLTKRHYGLKLLSSSLAADAWNDGVDTVSGTVALIGVSLESLAGRSFRQADDIGGCAVGLIVILLGARIVRDTTFQLMDTMPDGRLLEQIRKTALQVPGALGIEKCFARKTGLQYHVDLHLEVDPDMTVSASHRIATEVRGKIRSELPWVADVLVHVEPYGLGD